MTKKVNSYSFGKQVRLLALAALFLAPFWGAKAQEVDYSGTYCIASDWQTPNTTNRNYDATTLTNNYYLCPTDGWIYYKPVDDWSNDGETYPNPFLTTFKCRTSDYADYGGINNAKWIITKHGNKYAFYHTGTGKYMLYSGQITGCGVDRMRVHLETVTGDLPDNALFSITEDGRSVLIKPTSDHLTVNGGNKDALTGQPGKTGGPTGYENTAGIIGIYRNNDDNKYFYLEDYITRPTIAFNNDNLIEITAVQSEATLIYTTDGTTPTSSNGTQVNSNNIAFDPNDDVTTIKAVAVVNNELSNVATFTPPVLCGLSHKRLIQSQNNAWNGTDFHFYMIPGDEENNILKVNTTSLFRPTMEWYFLNAGVENGVQYYFIVNNANSKYLCYDATNKVYMDDYSVDNKFKFIIEASPTVGSFNIRPYGLTTGDRFLNKNSNNASPNAVNLYNNNNTANTLWKFIPTNGLDKTSPFSASVPGSDSYSYYKIASVGSSGYFILPGNPNVTTSNNASYERNMKWYFEVAQEADGSDWLTYYHVRNAVTGDYLYFTKDDNNSGACLEMRSTIASGSEERYKFTWAKTADANANYYIIPKMLKDKSQNQFSSLQRNNNTLQTNLTRGASNYAWTFVSSDFTCDVPVIAWSEGDNGYVITSTETDAKIYYTLGSGELTPQPGTLYGSPISVADLGVSSVTIRAIAARNGDGSDASSEASVTVNRVATPGFNMTGDGRVELTCATEGVEIYYEIGANPADPTISSTRYTGPIENASGNYIKAIAVKSGWINSAVATSELIIFACATPVIRKTSPTTFTIECSFPASGYQIRYTRGDNPENPTPTSGNIYEGEVSFNQSDLPFTVKAIAYADNYSPSEVATQLLVDDLPVDPNDDYHIIDSYDAFGVFVMMANGPDFDKMYKITADIDLSDGVDVISLPFTGELKAVTKPDGTWPVLNGLSHPIFNTINGGTVKNVFLDNVSIHSTAYGENVGAICGEATGDSRIYNCGVLATGSTANTDENGYTFLTNCSSTISGSNYVGGLVGLLDGSSRVINCFSYANITGGSYVGGIVGYNNVATIATNLKTMVMNCMFYGDITGGTSKAPIYNGEIITNDGDADGVNNFNYFRSEASYVQDQHIDVYNCALAAETRFLQRFEFFRHLLNSNRTLAAWWATGDRDNKDEMLKWVMEPDQIGTTTPYPILKTPGKYYSVVNYEPSSVMIDAENEHRNEGRKLGELTVNIRMGSGDTYPVGATITNSDTTLIITDKDPAHFLFNYGKVQLPYYNQVGTNNYRKSSDGNSRVVTGWKIVSISGGTPGTFNPTVGTAPNDAPNWNFADRKCTNKDLYGTNGSNRIFNQGAYWDVPEGVTAITIEPYWAKCVYLADEYLDIVYQSGYFPGSTTRQDAMSSSSPVTLTGGGTHYTNGSDYTINGVDLKVYTTLANATAALSPSSGTVYDNAIVLVGNYHYYNHVNNGTIGNSGHSYTVMSADLDFDNEPDANLILRFNGRTQTHPVRYDFLNLIGLGMAQKVTGTDSNGTYNFGIMQPLNWFEVTNTGLFRCTQFEYSPANRQKKPIILQGGVVEQWVTQQQDAGDRVQYFHVGGNVWFKEFHRGSHQDNSEKSTPHPPVSVTGGDFNEFYLTGLYQPHAVTYDDNAECYINGGRFGVMAGAGMEGIGTRVGNGNVTWLIDNADISEFYGGGINASNPVFGNISTTISNSHVDSIFCGGPKFGDMEDERTVTTVATNCTFKTFFGAGYGGNSYSRRPPYNQNNVINIDWNAWVIDEYTRKYDASYGGVETQINYQFIPHSSNIDNVARLWIEYVGFSLATTHEVSSTLTDCTVTGNFYGGGSLGKVDVSVTSVLDGCKVKGNVYGAGFSVSLPPVEVMNLGGFQTPPHYDEQAGVFLNHVFPNTVTYTWQHSDEVNSTQTAIDTNNHILYTQEDLGTLGSVLGNVTLTLRGTTVVGTEGDSATGQVFGGGDASAVTGNTTVNLQGGTKVLRNVYGGGNEGTVGGNSQVIIQDPSNP